MSATLKDVAARVGVSIKEEGAYATPSLTTVTPPKDESARHAVRLLLERIDGTRNGPPQRITPPFSLVVRESTVGAPMARASPPVVTGLAGKEVRAAHTIISSSESLTERDNDHERQR